MLLEKITYIVYKKEFETHERIRYLLILAKYINDAKILCFNIKHLQCRDERRQATGQIQVYRILQRVEVSVGGALEFGDHHVGIAILWYTILSARFSPYHCKIAI